MADDNCGRDLVAVMAALDVETTAGTLPPLVASPYTREYVCEHGTTYYLEPTTDQIAAWARDGVK